MTRLCTFAIILTTYNRAGLLPRAIRSVLSQDYTDLGLYVVDDGSDDDTESVVSPFLADRRVRYIRNPVNRGYLYSRNVGLDRVESDGADWFLWLDDDDQLLEGCLTTARKEIERYPGFGMFVFSSVNTEGMSLDRMETSGPQSFLRERVLKPTYGDAHEFMKVSCLDGARLNVSPPEPGRYFMAKLSLRAGGAVFCNIPTRVKEYRDDGMTAKIMRLEELEKIEQRLRINLFLVHDWLRVIRHHPRSLTVYQVEMKVLARLAVNWLRYRKRHVRHRLCKREWT